MINRFAERHPKAVAALPYLFLALVVTAVYANTLSGSFVWDDLLFAKNQIYWQFDFRTIFFSLANGLEYQPIRDLSFLADIALWGDRPSGFHLTNLLLFGIIVLLVHKLAGDLQKLCSPPAEDESNQWFVPLLTALLFAVHPLRSEVVAWITQRNTLLATLFFLTTLLLFFRYLEKQGKSSLLAAASAAFLLALFSKATVVILPLLLLLLLVVRQQQEPVTRRSWLSVAPFFAFSAAVSLLHLAIARQTTVITSTGGNLTERLAVALQIPFFYLQKTVLPLDISAMYTETIARSLLTPRAMISAIVLIFAAAMAWQLRRRFPPLFAGFGWFIITLIPVSNLFATSPVVADRYLFLPAIGICFLAASLVKQAVVPGWPGRSVIAATSALLILLSVLTFKQNRVWQNDLALWSNTAIRSPNIAGVWYNLGRAWHRTTRLGLALEAYLRAIALDPGDSKSLDNAAALISSSEGPLPIRHIMVRELAAQLPPYPAGLSLIGYTGVPWQHPEKGEELFLRLLSADQNSMELRLGLANLYLKSGSPQRAEQIYRQMMQTGLGHGEAEFGLARIAAAWGDRQEAARLAAIARLKGGVPDGLLRELEK
jgi:tetratricopeptide (TPR) repeat protein